MELSTFLKYRKGKSVRTQNPSDSNLLPILTPEYLRNNSEAEFTSPNGNVVVDDNEIILLWDGSNAGEFFWSKKGVLASTMVILDFNRERFNLDYLYYSFKYFEPFLKTQTRGSGIPHVDKEVLLRHNIHEIDITEQAKIAEVLAIIDRAIAQTEALIAKHQRIKTGLMQDLLTRGIDEHGQLRDPSTHKFKSTSLGMIPDEWEVGHLYDVTDMQVGFAFKSRDFQDGDGVLLLRGENVGNGKPDWSNPKYLSNKLAQNYDDYQLQEGDIVIGMDRTFTKQGCKISIIDKDDLPSLLVQRVGRFASKAPVGFLRALFSSKEFQLNLQKQEKGMDIPHLSKDEILGTPVRIPRSDEMGKIAQVTFSAETNIIANKASLGKLKSIKTGLMQDLLSGRVSVKPLMEG